MTTIIIVIVALILLAIIVIIPKFTKINTVIMAIIYHHNNGCYCKWSSIKVILSSQENAMQSTLKVASFSSTSTNNLHNEAAFRSNHKNHFPFFPPVLYSEERNEEAGWDTNRNISSVWREVEDTYYRLLRFLARTWTFPQDFVMALLVDGALAHCRRYRGISHGKA